MEELRNIQEGQEAASVAATHPSFQGTPPQNSPRKNVERQMSSTRTPRAAAGGAAAGAAARSLSVSSLLSPPSSSFVPFFNPLTIKEAKKIPLNRWMYKDDFGKIQGPYDALKIIRWIQGGFFDRRGNTLFKKIGDTVSFPLIDILPIILTEGYAAMVLRMQTPEQQEEEEEAAAAAAAEEEEMQIVETKPMDISDQLQDIESVLDVKTLHKSLGTCDLLLILIPPKRQKGDKQKEAIHDSLLKRAHVPQRMFKIPVHSTLLKLSSPIWLKEITAIEEKYKQRIRYAEGEEKEEMLKYTIECQHPEALRCIINYIYGDRTCLSGGDSFLLVNIYILSLNYKLDKIAKEAIKPLSSPLSIEGIIYLASSCEAANCLTLLQECVRILADLAFALFSGMRHLQLGPKTMALLLQHDNIQLDEIQIYLAAAAWLHQYIDNFAAVADPAVITADVQCIYKSIRFCSMSPRRLEEIREEELEGTILNACLRKFNHQEWNTRVFPWIENSEYEVSWGGSLYPTSVCRSSSKSSSKNSSSSSRGGRQQWAWIIGTKRLINEALYAIEVIHTNKGNIRCGVAIEDHINRCKLACYFDREAKAFVTCSIGNDPLSSAYHTYHSPLFIYWPRIIRRGDILLIRLSFFSSSLFITINIFNTNIKATFSLPYNGPVVYPCHLLFRPFIEIFPFFQLLDDGDTLALPEIQTEAYNLI